jgi:hypothetical protein
MAGHEVRVFLRPLYQQHELLDQGFNLPEPWQQEAETTESVTITTSAYSALCYGSYNIIRLPTQSLSAHITAARS